MNNSLFKRLVKTQKEDIIHSSAFASAQNKGIGTASTESFSARRTIDQNRTHVRSYGESKIACEPTNRTIAKPYEPTTKPTNPPDFKK